MVIVLDCLCAVQSTQNVALVDPQPTNIWAMYSKSEKNETETIASPIKSSTANPSSPTAAAFARTWSGKVVGIGISSISQGSLLAILLVLKLNR
jgi:hypothetical protein